MAYSKEQKEKIFKHIFTEINKGRATRTVLANDAKMPKGQSFFDWLNEDKDKVEQYVRACDNRTELKFLSIEADYMATPERDKETGKIDTGWVQLQRLKIDAKKWELAKLMPKKYGDRLQTEISGTVEILPIINIVAPKMIENVIDVEFLEEND